MADKIFWCCWYVLMSSFAFGLCALVGLIIHPVVGALAAVLVGAMVTAALVGEFVQ